MLVILKNLLFLYLSLIIYLFIGKAFFSCIRINFYQTGKPYLKLFLELIIGATIIVLTYSILRTQFKTINILVFFLPFFYIKKLITKDRYISTWGKNFNFRQIQDDLLRLILLLIPIYVFQLVITLGQNGELSVIHIDHFCYSKISKIIEQSGHENPYGIVNLLYPKSVYGLRAYHYFDLWLNAFLSSVFNNPSILTLILIFYPSMALIFLIGSISIWENFRKIRLIEIAFCYCFLFVLGIEILDLEFLQHINWRYTTTGVFCFTVRKSIIIATFTIPCVLLFFHKRKSLALIILILISGITAAEITFSVIGGIGAYLVLDFIISKIRKRSYDFKPLLFMIILLIYFALVYILWGQSADPDFVLESFKETLLNISSYKYWIYTKMILPALRMIFVYLPYLLILLISLKTIKNSKYYKELTQLIIISVLMFFSGVFLYSLTYKIGNNAQQLYSGILPIINVIIITLLIVVFERLFSLNFRIKKNLVLFSLLTIFFLFVTFLQVNTILVKKKNDYGRTYSNYGNEYLANIEDEISSYRKNVYYSYIFNNSRIANKGIAWFHLYTHRPGDHLIFHGYENYINLNDPYCLEYIQNFTSFHNPFYRFIEFQKANNEFVSIKQSQIDFLKKFKIPILFTGSEVKVNLKEDQIKQVITDPISGERCYILNL